VTRKNFQFTSESVSEGHPDKVCDRISDEIVDLYFREGAKAGVDPYNIRVACETLATTNRIIIAGEVRGPTLDNALIEETARAAVKDIGYEQEGFHWRNAEVEILLHAQSADIAQGVDAAGNKDEGAGDQGIMFGYACNETPELMPAPLYYAHNILKLLSDARRSGVEKKLGPDAKSQVTVRYANGAPVEATQIVVSHQHTDASLSSEDVGRIVRPYVEKALPAGWITPQTVWHINPTGKFYIGGPDGDCGLTGRKIIVDTYGGAAPHGGGAFSGKDPTKVDRSAAYAARYRGGLCRPLHDPIVLCDRRRQAAVDLRRPAWDRACRGEQARDGVDRGHEPFAARHSRAFGLEQTDFRAHFRLWPFWPRARQRRRFLLGEDRPGEPAAGPRLLIGQDPEPDEEDRASDAPDSPRRALYGRSRGKTLRAHHARLVKERLPRLEIDPAPIADCADLFPFAPSEMWLEIGFGGGEHLIARARENPDVGFIGCEPFINGVAKLLAAIEEEALGNIRVRAGDARSLIEAAPTASLSRIFILYPDPWPKRRQNKRRLISPSLIRGLARAARPGAELRFATDIDDYAGWTLNRFLASADFVWRAEDADDWRRPWADWRGTRYEAKARREGRKPVYLTFTRA